jgi:hypothetical protein
MFEGIGWKLVRSAQCFVARITIAFRVSILIQK